MAWVPARSLLTGLAPQPWALRCDPRPATFPKREGDISCRRVYRSARVTEGLPPAEMRALRPLSSCGRRRERSGLLRL
jgi:hypothetical protein